VNQTLDVCETVAGSGIATVDLTALNSAITGGAALTVDWFTNPDLTTPVVSPANASANNNTVFYARVSNSSTSCYSPATAAITVNVKPSGTGTIAGALSLCTNNPSTYTISGISDALRYNWQVSGGLEILSQNGASASIQSVSGTSGTITVTSENGCGSGSTASLEVQILTSPEVQIVTPSEVITGEIAEFSFESASAIQAIQWDFGDNATSTELAPQHQYTTDGNYQVALTVLDDASCETTESITLVVLPLPELSDTNIKNVITANGDSQNGFLYIENIEKHPSNQVVLLDRWGVEVFKKDNYVNDWDARRNGEFLPAGQYVCVVKLNETGKIFTRTVSIIKRK
jgi:gliding motility-associated-like protein